MGESAGDDDGVDIAHRAVAVPERGGVTTEDEMFILLGAYYLVP